MIAPEILKKHNLKAVPFSCIGEGQTFHDEYAFFHPNEFDFWKRQLYHGYVQFADGGPSGNKIGHYRNATVYVPVWRPTKITL